MIGKIVAALAVLAPASAVAQVAGIAPVLDYNQSPIAAGSWSYQAVAGGSDARFVDSSATARLVIHCTKATRRVSISRISSVPATSFNLWTSSASRSLAARFEPNAMRVTAELAAYDALLDAIAYSRGRIAVTMAGVETLVVPAWPEAARAIEDCRI